MENSTLHGESGYGRSTLSSSMVLKASKLASAPTRTSSSSDSTMSIPDRTVLLLKYTSNVVAVPSMKIAPPPYDPSDKQLKKNESTMSAKPVLPYKGSITYTMPRSLPRVSTSPGGVARGSTADALNSRRRGGCESMRGYHTSSLLGVVAVFDDDAVHVQPCRAVHANDAAVEPCVDPAVLSRVLLAVACVSPHTSGPSATTDAV